MDDREIRDREWCPERDKRIILEMPLREADNEEIKASVGPEIASQFTPNECILGSIYDYCRIAFADGEPFAVYGVNNTNLKGHGVVWAVGTDLISRGGLDLVGWGVSVVRRLFEEYHCLFNYVDARNTAHIRWLKGMGFKFPGRTIKQNGYPFHFFYKIKEK